MRNTLLIRLIQALFSIVALWTSLFFAWHTLSQINFTYPLLHDLIAIDETISEYGPQNRYKRGFELTTEDERSRLFNEIIVAVNHDGQGLERIAYRNPEGETLDTLLRQPEVVHLKDVANLLGTLRTISYVALGLLVCGIAGFWRWRLPFPRIRNVFAGTLISCAVVAVAVVAYGAEALFYQWHTLVFPEGHQWFFYYQDSLMTTLMKAPDIFGFIAGLLVLFSLGYLLITLRFVRYVLTLRPLP